MKFILFLIITTLLAAFSVAGQTRKTPKSKLKKPVPAVKSSKDAVRPPADYDEPPPPPPLPKPKAAKNERLTSNNFTTVTIGKWGVASLSLPGDLTNAVESSEPSVNGNVSWTTYSYRWQQPAAFYPTSLEVDLTVTNWNADFKTVVPDLRPDLATPDNLILLDLIGDENAKKAPGSLVKESKPLKIGAVSGAYFLSDSPAEDNRFMAGWCTYRYFEGKAQRISLTFTGRKDEMEKTLKIIQSLKLE